MLSINKIIINYNKMATPLIGNFLVSNITSSLSHTSLRGIARANEQILSNNISANVTLGSGNYKYNWTSTGTPINFSDSNGSSTNCSYNSLHNSGSTSVYCTITDTNTGIQVTTGKCDIIWPIQATIPITSVTWSIPNDTSSTYNGSAQSVTVVSINPPGANGNYTITTTPATDAGGVATTTITGTGAYTGTFTSPTLTINKAVITITASNASMTYRDSLPTFGYTPSGFLGSDNASVIIGTVTHSTTGSSTANVGSYTITPIISGLSATNYTFSASNGTLTINKAVITITASNASMTYRDSLPTFGYTPSGFLGSDNASVIIGTVTHSTTGSSTANVGSYTITPIISGLSATNYTFSASNGTLTINKAVITITASNASMTYRDSLPTFGYTPSGFLGSDNASVITGTVTHSTTGSSTSNVGSYTITPIISGLSATNYTFSASNGTLTINKAVITITASNASISYGSSLPTFGHTPSGFLGSDNASVITGTVTHSTTGSSTANVGSYTITPIISGLSATNYTFSASNGTLTINAIALSATTTTGSTPFNGDIQSVNVISGINGTYSGFTSVSGTNAGGYTTTIHGIGNYTGSVVGTLTISPATISLTGTNQSFAYDGTTKSITYTVGGAARNDYSYIISGTSGINVGTYTATITSTTSNYVISPTLNSFTWNITTPLTASTTTSSATYNGFSQTVTVLSGINGTYSGSTSVSGTNAGGYTTTIYGMGNYTGSVTGTLTISAAPLTASTTSFNTPYNRSLQSFTIGGINGTYVSSPTVSGTNAGSYTTRIFGIGNYTGYVDGTLNIYQANGYIDIFYGGVYDSSYTSSIIVPVRTSNAAFTVTHSTSGPGAADAQHTSFGHSGPYNWNQSYDPVPPGAVVRNTNPQTQGFVVTITASINDPNYGLMIAETTVTVNAYVPPSGGGGFVYE